MMALVAVASCARPCWPEFFASLDVTRWQRRLEATRLLPICPCCSSSKGTPLQLDGGVGSRWVEGAELLGWLIGGIHVGAQVNIVFFLTVFFLITQ